VRSFISLVDGSIANTLFNKVWSVETVCRNVDPDTLKPFLATNSFAIFLFFLAVYFYSWFFPNLTSHEPLETLAINLAFPPEISNVHSNAAVDPISIVDTSLN